MFKKLLRNKNENDLQEFMQDLSWESGTPSDNFRLELESKLLKGPVMKQLNFFSLLRYSVILVSVLSLLVAISIIFSRKSPQGNEIVSISDSESASIIQQAKAEVANRYTVMNQMHFVMTVNEGPQVNACIAGSDWTMFTTSEYERDRFKEYGKLERWEYWDATNGLKTMTKTTGFDGQFKNYHLTRFEDDADEHISYYAGNSKAKRIYHEYPKVESLPDESAEEFEELSISKYAEMIDEHAKIVGKTKMGEAEYYVIEYKRKESCTIFPPFADDADKTTDISYRLFISKEGLLQKRSEYYLGEIKAENLIRSFEYAWDFSNITKSEAEQFYKYDLPYEVLPIETTRMP